MRAKKVVAWRRQGIKAMGGDPLYSLPISKGLAEPVGRRGNGRRRF